MNKGSKPEKISYAVFILFFIVLLGYIMTLGIMDAPTIWSVIIFAMIFVIFGAAIGVSKFMAEFRNEGKWKLDLFKLLIIGIPVLLIFSLFLINPGTNEKFYMFLYNLQPYLLNPNVLIFLMTLFGYTIITSFYKSEDTEMLCCEGESCCGCDCEDEAAEDDQAVEDSTDDQEQK